jgi:hypothetical protein
MSKIYEQSWILSVTFLEIIFKYKSVDLLDLLNLADLP